MHERACKLVGSLLAKVPFQFRDAADAMPAGKHRRVIDRPGPNLPFFANFDVVAVAPRGVQTLKRNAPGIDLFVAARCRNPAGGGV